MFIIAGGRGTGKTCRLLDMAYKNNAIVLCKNPEEVMKKAHGYGIAGLTLCSFEEYPFYENREGRPMYILNIREFLEYFDEQVAGYSLTLEDLK